MDINQTYCGDHHLARYTNIELLCCAPETNISIIAQLKKKKRNGKTLPKKNIQVKSPALPDIKIYNKHIITDTRWH